MRQVIAMKVIYRILELYSLVINLMIFIPVMYVCNPVCRFKLTWLFNSNNKKQNACFPGQQVITFYQLSECSELNVESGDVDIDIDIKQESEESRADDRTHVDEFNDNAGNYTCIEEYGEM